MSPVWKDPFGKLVRVDLRQLVGVAITTDTRCGASEVLTHLVFAHAGLVTMNMSRESAENLVRAMDAYAARTEA
jgi:hypothetical protein